MKIFLILLLFFSSNYLVNAQWSTVYSFGSTDVNNFYEINFLSTNMGYVIGNGSHESHWFYNHFVYMTNDAGESWHRVWFESISTAGYQSTGYYQFISEDTIYRLDYITTGDGPSYLEKSIDGGINWENTYFLPAVKQIRYFKFIDENTGYVLINNFWDQAYNILRYSSNDSTLVTLLSDSTIFFRQITFSNDSTGFVLYADSSFQNRNILRTNDYGLNWSHIYTDTNYTFKSICFPTDSVGFILTNSSTILKTVDYGNTWNVLNLYSEQNLNSFDFPSEQIGCAVGDSGVIYKTEDGGINWFIQNSGITEKLLQVVFPTDSTGYILTSENKILKTTNGENSIYHLSETKQNILIYPNPNKGTFQIGFSVALPKNVSIQVVNNVGQVIYEEVHKNFSGNYSKEIDISSLANGIYMLNIKVGSNTYTENVSVLR